jgi:uncharacterized SAM-binding protein YcdF (DUF218 family)
VAPILLLSGGKEEPPRWRGANAVAGLLEALGVARGRLRLEHESTNTREQATAIVALAIREGWSRVVLVASHYHQFRAFLTVLQAIQDAGATHVIRLVNAPAADSPWFQCPAGMATTRAALLEEEMGKIDDYATRGHVASYADGLAYLRYWEERGA